MNYTPLQQAYIDSVGGHAHQSAVEIIGRLDRARSAALAFVDMYLDSWGDLPGDTQDCARRARAALMGEPGPL